MAAVRADDANDVLIMERIAVNVPLIFEPRTIAPVYLKGNFAANP